MTRQLNLRVDDEFAERLETLSKQIGRPMGAVLEAIGTPAIEAAEADIKFEAEALAAWEKFELTGICEPAEKIDALFDHALAQAKAVSEKKRG
jgi:predicted DNA-binding protein